MKKDKNNKYLDALKNPKTLIKNAINKVDKLYEKVDNKLYNLGDMVTKDIPKTVLEKPITTAATVAPGGTVIIATGMAKKGDKVSKYYKGEKISKFISNSADDKKTGYGKIRNGLNNLSKGIATQVPKIVAFSEKDNKTMIKFRQGMYSIPEGHYTGPKDLDDVPGTMKVVGAATLGGTIIGGIAGHILGEVQDKFDSDYKKGAKIGAGTGLAAGVAAKVLLNVMHNPMTTVKFNEVDKTLRRNFGIYSGGGFVIGDSRDNRKKFDDAFVINDRNVTDYRINLVVQDNQVILYTFQLSDKELKIVSNSLDYFCKKYFGMNYTSKVIDSRTNTYSVTITFTNYQVISDFLMEISDELKVKINLLNNKAIVDLKLLSSSSKEFSNIEFDDYDLLKLFVVQGVRVLLNKGKVTSSLVMGAIEDAKNKLSETERVKIFGPSKRKDFDNAYLIGLLSNSNNKQDKDYTIDKNSNCNMSLFQGILTIAAPIGSKESKKIEETKYFNKSEISRTVAVYTYSMKSKQELNIVLQKIINTRIIPNIYTGSL